VEDEWAIYDTGHFSDRALLLESLKQISLSPLDITQVFLSHLHFDHILNVPLFRNASVTVAKSEVEYAGRVLAGEIDDLAIPENFQDILSEHQVRLVEGSLRIDDRTAIEVLPGHTPGGLVVYREGEPATVALCGDVIKNAWDAVKGEPTAASLDPLSGRESIHHVLKKAQVIVPGHDRPFLLHGDALDFLSPFSWQIMGNLLPGPLDEVMLDIRLPATVLGHPRRFS
jgi:glyoxylase-like metal-dependent hydrolase (beta-lactamase superfamily II)